MQLCLRMLWRNTTTQAVTSPEQLEQTTQRAICSHLLCTTSLVEMSLKKPGTYSNQPSANRLICLRCLLEANRRPAILESSNAVRHALHTILNTMQNLGPQNQLCSSAFLMETSFKLLRDAPSVCFPLWHDDGGFPTLLCCRQKITKTLKKPGTFLINHLRID